MLRNLRLSLNWQTAMLISIALIALILIFFLYAWRLGSLTTGLSPTEAAARGSSSSLQAIINNPVNAPHKLMQYVFQYFGQHGAFWMRLPSAMFTIVFLLSFYFLLRSWFGNFISALGTLFLAATPWVIILARSATPDVLLLIPIVVFACYAHLSMDKKWSNLVWLIFVASLAVGLYVPGMFWLTVIGLIVGARQLIKLSAQINNSVLFIGFTLFLLLVLPVVFAIARDPSIAKTLLAIPKEWPNIMEQFKIFVWAILSLVWKTNEHIPYIIGRLPILDVAQVALSVIGGYALWNKARRVLIFLAILIAAGLVLTTLNRNIVLLTIAIPAIAFLTASGLRFLYVRWFSIFPRNPLPRGLAFTLMSLLVLFHLAYGIRYALVAWPNTLDTKQTYVLK